MKNMLVILLSIFVISLPTSAYAGKMRFGDDHHIRKLMDVDFSVKDGEKIYLGHMVTIKFFILGVYVKDDGYVLGVVSEPGKYYPLNKEKLDKLQQEGFLPKELPKYKLEVADYIFGYSLYILIIVIALWSYVSSKIKRRRNSV
ncbi:MAG: hypothetical protein R3D71_07520 [Rickettsiales bacterium]